MVVTDAIGGRSTAKSRIASGGIGRGGGATMKKTSSSSSSPASSSSSIAASAEASSLIDEEKKAEYMRELKGIIANLTKVHATESRASGGAGSERARAAKQRLELKKMELKVLKDGGVFEQVVEGARRMGVYNHPLESMMPENIAKAKAQAKAQAIAKAIAKAEADAEVQRKMEEFNAQHVVAKAARKEDFAARMATSLEDARVYGESEQFRINQRNLDNIKKHAPRLPDGTLDLSSPATKALDKALRKQSRAKRLVREAAKRSR